MIMNATKARNNFFQLIDEAVTMHEPTYITSRRGNVVLLPESDYKAMQETFYLLSIPGMREKIVEGISTQLSECVEDDGE